MPDWAAQCFNRFIEHSDELFRVLLLSMDGISLVRGRYVALSTLKALGETIEGRNHEEDLVRATKERDLAQHEIDHGFPLLHELATVALWTSLEALVRSFAASWLENQPDGWQADSVRRLKVCLGDYEPLSGRERCLWVVDQLDQGTGGPLKNGIGRFESLLRVFGLDGPFPDEKQKKLFELSQVRNVIIHRAGLVDRKLLDSCPWLELNLGERLKISHLMWRHYSNAAQSYVLELVQRVRVKFGNERYKRAEVYISSWHCDPPPTDIQGAQP